MLPPNWGLSDQICCPQIGGCQTKFWSDIHRCPPSFCFLQSFGRIQKWIRHAETSPNLSILAGGGCDDKVGYFVQPCIIETKDPKDPIMQEVSLETWLVGLEEPLLAASGLASCRTLSSQCLGGAIEFCMSPPSLLIPCNAKWDVGDLLSSR